jgi:hypothetical protein
MRATESLESDERFSALRPPLHGVKLQQGLQQGTQALHKCHTVGTQALHKGHTAGTQALHKCHTVGTQALHKCHTVGTQGLHKCHTVGAQALHKCRTLGTQGLHKCLTVGTQGLHKCDTVGTCKWARSGGPPQPSTRSSTGQRDSSATRGIGITKANSRSSILFASSSCSFVMPPRGIESARLPKRARMWKLSGDLTAACVCVCVCARKHVNHALLLAWSHGP